MGSVGRLIEAELLDPAVQDTGILTSADVCRFSTSTREQVILSLQMSLADPSFDSLASRRRNLELHWSLGFALQHARTRCHSLALADVANPQRCQIARAELAVDAEVE